MSDVNDGLRTLLELLSDSADAAPSPVERGVLLIYPPEEELLFRERLEEHLLHIEVPFTAIDVEQLPFECLDSQGLLEDAYRLEAEDPKGLHQYLAEQL